MRRIGGDLDDRSAQEELLGPQPGDNVLHRELQVLNRECARVAQADDGAAAADELVEPLQILGRQLIRVLGPDGARVPPRPPRPVAAPATGTRASSAMTRTSIFWLSGDLKS